MIRAALPLLLVLLAGCARSEEASFAPLDEEVNGAAGVLPPPEGDDDEVALGEWRAGLQGDQQILEFGPAGAAPLFSFACDARRNVLMQRHGATPAGDLPVMLITVGSETRRLAVASAGGAIPMLRATLPANDPFRTVLSDTSLPITVRIGDLPPLVMPPSPLIRTYATGCASGENQGTAATDASANAAATSGNAAAAGE